MIKFKNISKKINSKTILSNINFKIHKGELVVLIGPSGCGKTTTLKMINKLIKPSSGEIYINSEPISHKNTIKLRRNIGYVIQNTGLFPHLTIKENIELIPKLKKESLDKIEKKTCDLLNLVGLDPNDYLNKYPNELSGGQQQRIGVARAFATDSDIILMDEPFSALDPITRSSLQEELFLTQETLRKTIIFVTHDMDEAIKLGDKICIMNNGSIVQYDTPENILRKPVNEFVSDFIGVNRIWSSPEFIKAKDIMIKSPICTSSSRNILQAIEIMKSNKVDSLLIVNKGNILEGLVTLKNIGQNIPKETKLSEIMERNVVSINENDDIIQLLEIVNKNSFGYMPVTNEKKQLVGLITKSSIVSILSEQFLNGEEIL